MTNTVPREMPSIKRLSFDTTIEWTFQSFPLEVEYTEWEGDIVITRISVFFRDLTAEFRNRTPLIYERLRHECWAHSKGLVK